MFVSFLSWRFQITRAFPDTIRTRNCWKENYRSIKYKNKITVRDVWLLDRNTARSVSVDRFFCTTDIAMCQCRLSCHHTRTPCRIICVWRKMCGNVICMCHIRTVHRIETSIDGYRQTNDINSNHNKFHVKLNQRVHHLLQCWRIHRIVMGFAPIAVSLFSI